VQPGGRSQGGSHGEAGAIRLQELELSLAPEQQFHLSVFIEIRDEQPSAIPGKIIAHQGELLPYQVETVQRSRLRRRRIVALGAGQGGRLGLAVLALGLLSVAALLRRPVRGLLLQGSVVLRFHQQVDRAAGGIHGVAVHQARHHGGELVPAVGLLQLHAGPGSVAGRQERGAQRRQQQGQGAPHGRTPLR
jgi:hypothetical protein